MLIPLVSGCATTQLETKSQEEYPSMGLYQYRLLELQSAYQNSEITKAEYLQLKQELDSYILLLYRTITQQNP